jgi:hypothetical protein
MLVIRAEQWRFFERSSEEAWVARISRYITRTYPRSFDAMGEDGTRAFIRRAIAKGRANHVETQGGIGVLLELMIQFGEDFQYSRDKVWAHEMLAHPTLPAQLKLTLMHRRMTELSKGRVIVPFVPADNGNGAPSPDPVL